MEIKEALAAEAVKIVSGARRAAYGKPEQNFERIARLWNAHMLNTGRDGSLTPVDVATFCRLIKEARLAETPGHRDSFVDILGYTLCQAEIALPTVAPLPLAPSNDPAQDAISQQRVDAANKESLPAWQRAKVGDLVRARLTDGGPSAPFPVSAVDVGSPTTRLAVQTSYREKFWLPNHNVLSIERAA